MTMPAVRKRSIASPSARVQEVRRAGHVLARHTFVAGTGTIGMVIPCERGGRQLALCVHGPIKRIKAKQDLILWELRTVFAAAGALRSGS